MGWLRNSGDVLMGGTPNWRDPTDYHSECWDIDQWRWEFKRRDSDLRMLYFELIRNWDAEITKTDCGRIDAMRLPENEDIYFYLSPANTAKWGFGVLFNPLYSRRAFTDEVKRHSFERRTIHGAHFDAVSRGKTNALEMLGIGVAIAFDPNRPIQPQIDGLEDYLLSLRHHAVEVGVHRHRRDKWLTYLRIIDARDAGASWSECCDVLPVTMKRNSQSARDTHTQARRLQAAI